jgi:hypothetical protein
MKIPFEKKFWFIILIMPIYIHSCCGADSLIKTTLPLRYLQIAQLDSGRFTFLTILQTYPAQSKCNSIDNYSNLYICRRINGDSLYIFEECKKVSDLAYSSEHYMGVIDKNILSIQESQKAIIFVPKDFRFSNKIKYIFANIGYMPD